MSTNISLTQDELGQTIMHRPDCPIVAQHRAAELPIATLFGIEVMPADVVKCAVCLAPDKAASNRKMPG